jgi:4'-phosphopantetheinyl transferase
VLESLNVLLGEEERSRARRFRFPHLTAAFVQTHAALRILAGHRLGVDPRSLTFSFNSNGKPSILNSVRFEFNLSHSGGLAIFAFAFRCQLGVDIEVFRELVDGDAIVERFFSAAERDEFRTVDANLRSQAFLNGWTRKEAYVKARGGGLSIPLDAFSVSLRPGALPVLTAPDAQACSDGDKAQWQIQALDIEPGYTSALVYSGAPRAVRVFPVMDTDSVWTGFRNTVK